MIRAFVNKVCDLAFNINCINSIRLILSAELLISLIGKAFSLEEYFSTLLKVSPFSPGVSWILFPAMVLWEVVLCLLLVFSDSQLVARAALLTSFVFLCWHGYLFSFNLPLKCNCFGNNLAIPSNITIGMAFSFMILSLALIFGERVTKTSSISPLFKKVWVLMFVITSYTMMQANPKPSTAKVPLYFSYARTTTGNIVIEKCVNTSIDQSNSYTFSITVANKSPARAFYNIISSCGCLVLSTEKINLLPNKKAVIVAKVPIFSMISARRFIRISTNSNTNTNTNNKFIFVSNSKHN